MFINESNMIKLLRKHKQQIRVEVLPNNKINVSDGYSIYHIDTTYYKTLAFLQEEGYLSPTMEVLKGDCKLQALIEGFEAKTEAKITKFIVESDHDKPKSKRLNMRIFKCNGVNKTYNEDYIQVFNSKLATEYQLTYKTTDNGYNLIVYYNDIRIGMTSAIRTVTLEGDLKTLVS